MPISQGLFDQIKKRVLENDYPNCTCSTCPPGNCLIKSFAFIKRGMIYMYVCDHCILSKDEMIINYYEDILKWSNKNLPKKKQRTRLGLIKK